MRMDDEHEANLSADSDRRPWMKICYVIPTTIEGFHPRFKSCVGSATLRIIGGGGIFFSAIVVRAGR